MRYSITIKANRYPNGTEEPFAAKALTEPEMQQSALNESPAKLRAVAVLACAACLVVLLIPTPAYAYVDPSVMTYTIQALAGVAVAVAAVAGVAWRRLKRYMSVLLDIDLDRNKVYEDDLIRANHFLFDPTSEPQFEHHERRASAHAAAPAPLTWPKRLLIAFAASILVSFTLYFFSPLEVVAANAGYLEFGVEHVWAFLLRAAIIISIVLALTLSLLRGRAFPIGLALVFAIGACMFIQALLLNQSLPVADGETVFWAKFTSQTITSAIVWVAVIAGLIALSIWKTRFSVVLCTFLSVFVIVVQCVSLALVVPQSMRSYDCYVTNEGMFELSEKSNVVVFVLDRLDNSYIPQLQEENPEVFTELDGFTYYSNVTGKFDCTRYALPFLLTGHTPFTGGSEDWWTGGKDFMSAIDKKGYSVGLYSPGLYRGKRAFLDLAINIVQEKVPMNEEELFDILTTCSLYRVMPWAFKPNYYFNTADMNKRALMPRTDADGTEGENDEPDIPNLFASDNSSFYDLLIEDGVTVSDDSPTGAFRLYHIDGSHSPYTLLEDMTYDPENATEWSSVVASFRIVNEFVDQLKAQGLYDDTTIVITSDHGIPHFNTWDIDEPDNPIFFVKPAESLAVDSDQADGYMEAVAVSGVPTGHDDFHATILAAVGADTGSFNGKPAWNVTWTDNATRYFYHTINSKYANTAETDVAWKEYAISGDAQDFANWTVTGTEYTSVRPD